MLNFAVHSVLTGFRSKLKTSISSFIYSQRVNTSGGLGHNVAWSLARPYVNVEAGTGYIYVNVF